MIKRIPGCELRAFGKTALRPPLFPSWGSAGQLGGAITSCLFVASRFWLCTSSCGTIRIASGTSCSTAEENSKTIVH